MEPRPYGEFDRQEIPKFFKIMNIHDRLRRHSIRQFPDLLHSVISHLPKIHFKYILQSTHNFQNQIRKTAILGKAYRN